MNSRDSLYRTTDLNLCTEGNQRRVCCVIVRDVSLRPIRTIAAQSGYHKRRLHPRSSALSQSEKKTSANSGSPWMFQRWSLHNTHEHTHARTCTRIHTPRCCISGSGCCFCSLLSASVVSFFSCSFDKSG